LRSGNLKKQIPALNRAFGLSPILILDSLESKFGPLDQYSVKPEVGMNAGTQQGQHSGMKIRKCRESQIPGIVFKIVFGTTLAKKVLKQPQHTGAFAHS
jgi:hypothetical protein